MTSIFLKLCNTEKIFIVEKSIVNSTSFCLLAAIYGLEGKATYFNGQSRITFDAHTPNSLFTTVDMLRFRMKTDAAEGVVFYAGGNQGDHICLELLSGRLYIDISLGKTLAYLKQKSQRVQR